MKKKQSSQEKEKEESVNRATALWTLPKKDIKDEDYLIRIAEDALLDLPRHYDMHIDEQVN